MREGFDAYMAQRVEFLKGHCQLFHGLNRLSDIKSIAFIADEEHVPDGEVILKQGAAADTAVIITTGACKVGRHSSGLPAHQCATAPLVNVTEICLHSAAAAQGGAE